MMARIVFTTSADADSAAIYAELDAKAGKPTVRPQRSMIVVDSSAPVAILFDEPEKQSFETIIASGEHCIMSAVNVHETATFRAGNTSKKEGA